MPERDLRRETEPDDPLDELLNSAGQQPPKRDPLEELRALGDEDPEPIDPFKTGLIPEAGFSQTARELDADGLIDRLTEAHRRDRERASQEAELKSRDSVPGGLTDPQQYAEFLKGIAPGAVKAIGRVPQMPDVFASRAQHNAARFGRRQLEVMDRIDRGEIVSEIEDAIGYQHMDAEQRQEARRQFEQAQRAFRPTPIQDRPLFRAGEQVQRFAEGMLPAAPGYETSIGRQLGEGIGSLVAGLPAAFIGPMPAAVVFGAMGVGEATQRAVDWDRRERAAGREGLTQDQIAVAGILGVGPGTTDILPVEALLGRVPLPMPPWLRSAVARAIGRVGGQAFIEAVQEGGQAALQNLIAREVYDPAQQVFDTSLQQEAALGGGVGAIAQTAKELGTWLLRSTAGRRAPQPAGGRAEQPPRTEIDLDPFAQADDVFRSPLAREAADQRPDLDLAASMVPRAPEAPESPEEAPEAPSVVPEAVASPEGQAVLEALRGPSERPSVAEPVEAEPAEGVPAERPPVAERPFDMGDFDGNVTTTETADGARVRTYAVTDPETGNRVAFATVKERDDDAWELVLARSDPAWRGKGVLPDLARAIERDIGQRLAPTGWLTAEEYADLATREPELVRYHQPAGPAFDDMWVAPKQMRFAATVLSEAARQSPGTPLARQAQEEARQFDAMRALVPSAVSGGARPERIGTRKSKGIEAPEKGLSDLVADLNAALELTTRHGRLSPGLKAAAGRAGKTLVGQFSRLTGVARIAIPNDIATLAHEGGHALETRHSTADAVRRLQDAHFAELITPVSRNHPAPKLNPSGFSGLDLDADVQQALVDAVTADQALRAMATAVGAAKAQTRIFGRPQIDQAAYERAQREAAVTRQVLIRRLGERTTTTLIDDVATANPPDVAAYVRQRFSKTGTPKPGPQLRRPSRTELSEAWAEFFRLYITDPKAARLQAPRLYHEFEETLQGIEPDMMARFRDVQRGFTALKQASPAGAVLSRVKSSVKPSMFKKFRTDLAEQGTSATLADKFYAFYHATADIRHPAKVAVEYLIEVGKRNLGLTLNDNERVVIKAAGDFYKRWRLAEHAKVWATGALVDGIRLRGEVDPAGPSFHDVLVKAFGGRARRQWNEEKAQLFGSYLVTRRMLAEWRRYERGELSNRPDDLIEKEVWEKARADFERNFPEFAEAAQLFYQFNRRHLQLKHQAGFLTDELYQDLVAREDYAPLNRIMDDGAPSTLTKAQGQNKAKLIYRFKGSTRDFINPLESVVQDVYATQARIALNDVIGAMDRLAREVGPGGGVIAERIPPTDVRAVTVDIREALANAARDIDPDQAQALLDLADAMFDQEAAATIFRAVPTEEKGEPIVYLWEKGKRIPIRLGDNRIARDIFEGFVALGRNNREIFFDVLAPFTQAFRFGVTKAPSYLGVNFIRDQLATWILSRDYVPFVTGFKGLGHVLRNDEAFKRYRAFAGISGVESNLVEAVADTRDVRSLRRKGFSAAPTALSRFFRVMELTEVASRVGHFEAAYKRALKDGFTPEEAAIEAAYAAHDVLDFSRKGAKMTQVVRIVAFLNSALQGLDAARRTLTGERDIHTGYKEIISPFVKAATGGTLSVAEKEALPNATRIWVKMALVGMLGLALAALYRDDDEYEEFNDYMKATHWFVKIGGVWWRIPKPFELAILSNIFEAGFDAVWRQDERAYVRFLESLHHTWVPPSDFNGLTAIGAITGLPKKIWETYVAPDPYSRPSDSAVPQHLRALPPEMQFTAYTSELARLIGATLKWSPAEIDQFIQNTFATLGRDVMALSDQVLPPVNQALGGTIPGVSKVPRADKSLEDFWILSRFTRREARGALSSQYFWQQMGLDGGKYTQAANGYRELLRAGNEREAKDLLDRLDPERRAYALLEVHFKEADQDMHPLNRARQVISAMSGIRRDMILDKLVKQSTVGKRYTDPEPIKLPPSKQKIVNEILEDLAMREARNALIVVGHHGWRNKRIMPTDGLLAELRAAVPEIADELDYRLSKGKNKVYPFEGVRSVWPKARERLLKEGADAVLVDLRVDAKFP